MRRLCDIREGDRFKYKEWIVEAIKPSFSNSKDDESLYDCKIITAPGDLSTQVGEIGEFWIVNDDFWTYLGNFSKTSNFEQLYNLLNQ